MTTLDQHRAERTAAYEAHAAVQRMAAERERRAQLYLMHRPRIALMDGGGWYWCHSRAGSWRTIIGFGISPRDAYEHWLENLDADQRR